MKRTGFDEHRDARVADEYLGAHAACTFCSRQTAKDDLNTYGARCFDCYREYCSQGRYYPPLSRADRAAMASRVRQALGGGLRLPGAQHIAQLQRRADAGEELSPGQRGFLQAVRRASGIVDEPVARADAVVLVEINPRPDPVACSAPADDEPPPWVLEEIADAEASRARALPGPAFPATNGTEASHVG